MASTVIHMAVANEINKVLKRDNNKLLIGSIAPDIAKLIGKPKRISHFIDEPNSDIPNMDRFLNAYRNNLDDDFVLGYYIHLYTDYLWFKYFLPEVGNDIYITKLDGTKVRCSGRMFSLYVYNDYTNLNIQLLDEYNMDLKIFYNKIPKFDDIIKEIPMDRLDIIVNQAAEIIKQSKERKDFLFNLENVNNFINFSKDLIISNLEELGIIDYSYIGIDKDIDKLVSLVS